MPVHRYGKDTGEVSPDEIPARPASGEQQMLNGILGLLKMSSTAEMPLVDLFMSIMRGKGTPEPVGGRMAPTLLLAGLAFATSPSTSIDFGARMMITFVYTDFMLIHPNLLSPAALRAVVEEFVTRDGTDDSSVERRIETVMRQLGAGIIELHFDGKTETCHILRVEEKPPAGDGGE